MENSTWAEIAECAAGQHGAIALDQLRRFGITDDQRRTLLARGRLTFAAPPVYRVAGAPVTVAHRQWVGLLCLGPNAVLSHEAAARLHRFDRCLPDTVEFTIPRSSRGVRAPLQVHTTGVLPTIDQVRVGQYPCTSCTRTVIDLARARVSRFRLEAAIDSAVRSGATSPTVLLERLGALRGPGRWGARVLDRLLVDAGGHTMLERRFLTVMREAGLPRPTTQVIHRREGRAFARVDFCFVDQSIVVEVSGRKGHSSPAERGMVPRPRFGLRVRGGLPENADQGEFSRCRLPACDGPNSRCVRRRWRSRPV